MFLIRNLHYFNDFTVFIRRLLEAFQKVGYHGLTSTARGNVFIFDHCFSCNCRHDRKIIKSPQETEISSFRMTIFVSSQHAYRVLKCNGNIKNMKVTTECRSYLRKPFMFCMNKTLLLEGGTSQTLNQSRRLLSHFTNIQPDQINMAVLFL